MHALGFSEHGNLFMWIQKKLACEKAGLKYLHGVECYLTRALTVTDPKTGEQSKVRDNFHTVLIAKNYDGVKEINTLVSRSYRSDHFYYKPRITFEEFLKISPNVIKISACLASPLNRMSITDPMYEKLLRHYDYLEIQAHNCEDQIAYNRHLAQMSQKFGIPLIAGTDTHSASPYKAECRTVLQLAKHIEFENEDSFDLSFKTYDQLVQMFRDQAALPEPVFLEAIENTNRMADSVDPFELDVSFKYPLLYGSAKKDREMFLKTIDSCLDEKLKTGVIPHSQEQAFRDALAEECRVFDKIDMSGFMLFMSELVTWCKSNGIPIGFNRGSCGGSRAAYVTNITDLNPEQWHTVFSRFCNEDRKEIGDIDIDVAPADRDKVYDYIINRFGQDKTAYILALGTVKAKGCIDEICRALAGRWDKEHMHPIKELDNILKQLKDENVDYKIGFSDWEDTISLFNSETKEKLNSQLLKNMPRGDLIVKLKNEYTRLKAENDEIFKKNPWRGGIAAEIKKELAPIEEKADKNHPLTSLPEYKQLAEKYSDVFYYFEGLLDVVVSQSMHPAGIVASPVTLPDHYGTLESDGKTILQIDMDCVHDVSLVKYDILGLKNIGIIKDAYALIGKPYPKSHEINWEDQAVWKDMLRSPAGIFQFEGQFAFSMLKQYEPHSIFDMSLITAALRPSGASYRDALMQHKSHKNPSEIIDELLKDNYGYLVYQEDVIKFLQEICGFSGSDADNTRRAIGRKDEERLAAALPKILDGYCSKSPQPREVAEQEAKEFVQIISDASNYMFGYNHSIGYCMIGYLCAYLRYYHPYEFITAYLNNADNDDDVRSGSELAKEYGITIIPPKFGVSKDQYLFDREQHVIAKGLSSVKYMNAAVANELYDLAQSGKPQHFMELLIRMAQETSLKTNQREILIKIDFFSEYGNAKELLRMMEIFQFFKNGAAKKVSKSKVGRETAAAILPFGTDVLKSGEISDSIKILDMQGLLYHMEDTVREMHLPDFDYKAKMQMQLDNLGYIDLTTNDPNDRRKLLITDLFPLRSKQTGETWGYAVSTRSIGTGKEARLTLRSRTFDRQPIHKNDTIFAHDVRKERGYWYLNRYEMII